MDFTDQSFVVLVPIYLANMITAIYVARYYRRLEIIMYWAVFTATLLNWSPLVRAVENDDTVYIIFAMFTVMLSIVGQTFLYLVWVAVIYVSIVDFEHRDNYKIVYNA